MCLNNRCAFELELVLLVEGVNKIDILRKLTNILIRIPENVNKNNFNFQNKHSCLDKLHQKKIQESPFSSVFYVG